MSVETIFRWPVRIDVKKALIALIVITAFVIGVALRLTMVLETETGQQLHEGGDTTEYYSYAYNLIHHGVYSKQWPGINEEPVPDAKRSPGYPLFLTFFLSDSADSFDAIAKPVAIAQGLISVITIFFAIGFFRGFLSWPWACGAAMMVAISPHLITINVNVMSESLFTFLLVVFCFCIRQLAKRKTWQWALLSGLAFGGALLIRPTLQYFLVFLLPAFFVFFPRRDAIRFGILLIAGFMLCYGPWMARNMITPIAKSEFDFAAFSIQKGMYPGLMHNDDPRTYGFPNHFDPQFDQNKTMASAVDEVFSRLRNEPMKYLQWFIIGKPSMLLSWGIVVGKGDIFIYPLRASPYQDNGVFRLTRELMLYIHWPVVILALLVAVFVWTGRSQSLLGDNGLIVARFSSLVLAYFILVHMAGTPLPRYAIPIKPVIYGLALLGLQLSFEAVRRYLRGRPAA